MLSDVVNFIFKVVGVDSIPTMYLCDHSNLLYMREFFFSKLASGAKGGHDLLLSVGQFASKQIKKKISICSD